MNFAPVLSAETLAKISALNVRITGTISDPLFNVADVAALVFDTDYAKTVADYGPQYLVTSAAGEQNLTMAGVHKYIRDSKHLISALLDRL